MPFAFMPVLVLITCVIHRSMLQFAIAVLGKTLTGRVSRIENNIIKKIVETSHYLKRRGSKAFVESLFSRS